MLCRVVDAAPPQIYRGAAAVHRLLADVITKKGMYGLPSYIPFLAILISVPPQQEKRGKQHAQTYKVGPGNQQRGLHHAQNGPELFLRGPFGGLLPRAVGARLRRRGRLARGGGRSVAAGAMSLISAMVRPSSSKSSCLLICHTGGRPRNGPARPHAAWVLRSCSARWRRGSGCGTCSRTADWPGTEWSPAAQFAHA